METHYPTWATELGMDLIQIFLSTPGKSFEGGKFRPACSSNLQAFHLTLDYLDGPSPKLL